MIFRKHNNENPKYKRIKINSDKYILKSYYIESGPYLSIWDISYKEGSINNPYARISLESGGKSWYKFDIMIYLKKHRNMGFGTFLMERVALWCHKNNVKHIYGDLSGNDYSNENWKSSLPFYNNLPNKVKYIQECHFLSSRKALSCPENLKDYSVGLEDALNGAAEIVALILN